MAISNPEHWFLKKHENGEIFGPVHFDKIREWARSAQISPQDMVSDDTVVWDKAPMVPELEMDWLVVVDANLLYGPTTSKALLEFAQLGEITPETALINCCTGQTLRLSETEFYRAAQAEPKEEKVPINPLLSILNQPQTSARANLQQRVRELEKALLDKHRKLVAAEESLLRLEVRLKDIETRRREGSGFPNTTPTGKSPA